MAARSKHLSGRQRVGIVLATALTAVTAAALTLDDLTCRAGAGTNRAALVIHWRAPQNSTQPPPGPCPESALAWGFYWNGPATAADLWQAVRASEPRLFTLLSTEGHVLGIGFDLNQNARFGAQHVTNFLGPAAFSNGIATVQSDLAEVLESLEPGDLYQGGWTNRRWHWWREAGGGGGFFQVPAADQWVVVTNPLAAQSLHDGAWVALALDAVSAPRPPGAPVSASPLTWPFARAVVAAQGPFGASPYDDPASVLGMPTQHFYDPLGGWSGGTNVRRVKLVEAAHHFAMDQTNKLLTTLRNGSFIVVEFDPPISNHPAHPYGVDLLVFGNAFYSSSGFVNESTDLNSLWLTGNLFDEPLKVSVSPGGTGPPGEAAADPATWPWYRYENGPFADTAFPTHAFEWDGANARWTDVPMDFTKPVNPALAGLLGGGGLSASEAVALYDGSGGGTGFDLAESGFDSVRYVRIEGIAPEWVDGEVDALAAVRPVVVGESLILTPQNVGLPTGTLWFQHPADADLNLLRLVFSALDGVAKVTVRPVGGALGPEHDPATVWVAVEIIVAGVNGSNQPRFAADAVFSLAGRYAGAGADLEMWERQEATWTRRAFVFDASANAVRAHGLATNVALVVAQITPPTLAATPGGPGRTFRFVPVPGWTHILERSTDLVNWTERARATPLDRHPVVLADSAPPLENAFYRLRLLRP